MILITNDDGDSEGLRMLFEVAGKMDKTIAIAPNRQRSAVSGALTLHKPMRLQKLEKDIYTLNGTPADCVLFCTYSGEFEKPDLVLSGINWGDNTGLNAIIGSGTIGACWQAALEGIPSIAFSKFTTHRNWRDTKSWGDKKKIMKIVSNILKKLKPKLGPDTFFNVNMPDDISAPKILMTNQIQKNRYRAKITKRYDPNGESYFWMTGGQAKIEEDTDFYEVRENKNITISEFSLSCFER